MGGRILGSRRVIIRILQYTVCSVHQQGSKYRTKYWLEKLVFYNNLKQSADVVSNNDGSKRDWALVYTLFK